MTRLSLRFYGDFSICLVLAVLALSGVSPAQTEAVIHAFQNNSVNDGISPEGGPVADGNGALYGTTVSGGKFRAGTVYKLAPPATQGGAWKQNILYSFTNGSDGASPSGNLVLTKGGKIYGAAKCSCGSDTAVVFELSPPSQSGKSWTESVVYGFQNSYQGLAGISSLVSDSKGRLYGTTYTGGRYKSGSVFVLSRATGSWKEHDIYSFQGNSGGLVFPGGLVLSGDGVLYGVTSYGGTSGTSAGTVFSLTPSANGGAWTESTIYAFGALGDGFLPAGVLALDTAGALYGTTDQGGQAGSGTVFQLAPASGGVWTESLLYSFQGSSDGSEPIAGVVFDETGSLYGSAQYGGNFACSYNGVNDGCGTVFKLIPPSAQGSPWTQQTLYAFAGGSDGVDPGQTPLLLVGATLYGTTLQGGDLGPCSGLGCGTVFEITQ